MSKSNHLVNYLDSHNVEAFLMSYLRLIRRGESLQLPSDERGWRDCLPSDCNHATDKFIEDLDALLTEKMKAIKHTDNVVDDLLKSLSFESQGSLSDAFTKEAEILDHIKEISVDIELLKSHLEKNDMKQFYLDYLIFNVHNKSVDKFPKSSEKEKITKQWIDLVHRQFNVHLSEHYASQLAVVWFYLVQKFGKPQNLEELERLYVDTVLNIERFKFTEEKKGFWSFLSKSVKQSLFL